MATPTSMTPTNTLQAAREETIDALCREFANDVLTMAELERRLTKAREAGTRDELRALLADLTRPGSHPMSVSAGRGGRPPVEPADATRTAPAKQPGEGGIRPGSHFAFAVMGGTRRSGKWAPPGSMLVVAIMGGIELDFREAVLAPGVTEINVFAFWGGVEITVPPDVHVDAHGLAIMAGFDQTSELESNPAPDAPTIRVNGVAIMAGVDIRVKERGAPKTSGLIEGGKS